MHGRIRAMHPARKRTCGRRYRRGMIPAMPSPHDPPDRADADRADQVRAAVTRVSAALPAAGHLLPGYPLELQIDSRHPPH